MHEADRKRIMPRAKVIEHNRRSLIWRDVLEAREALEDDRAPPTVLRERPRGDLVALVAQALVELERIDRTREETGAEQLVARGGDAASLAVRCPSCAAPPGNVCESTFDDRTGHVHISRVKAGG